MARLMSWMKINIRLLESPKDKTIAKLMLEGCNMGISQLSEYLNTYTKADDRSREITVVCSDSYPLLLGIVNQSFMREVFG